MARNSGAFVLDCSVTFAWFFADEQNPYADAVGRSFPNAEAIVPEIWPLEIANVLAVAERRRRCTTIQASSWLRDLSTLPITLDRRTHRMAWTEILSLARVHHLSAYDAAYLELAMRRRVALATLDQPLKSAARSLGVQEFTPRQIE